MPEQESFNLNDLRARLADDPEKAAYHKGKAAADRALRLLEKSGVIPPALEGMYPHQDIEFKQSLQKIAHSTGINPKTLYNPGNGRHVSLAEAFPDARTIFVDQDKDAVHEVAGQHYEATVGDMHSFTLPDGLKADMTLILNAGYMTQEELDRVVKDDGVVVVNNWHGAADYMRSECPGYELVTLEDPNKDMNIYGITQTEDVNTLYAFKKSIT